MSSEKKIVYSLMHIYECEDEDEIKELGIYSSQETAQKAIQRYFNLPGFCKHPIECFKIGECIIDEDAAWIDGFMTWQEIESYQEENNICRGDEFKKSIYQKEENAD